MEIIEKELEEKTIERVEDEIPELEDEPQPVKKPKKKRTQAQIDAFEKARLARTEKIAARKKQKEEEKIQKKEQKKVIKQKVEEELEQVKKMDVEMEVELMKEIVPDPTEPLPPSPQTIRKTTFQEEPEIRHRPLNPVDPIVNNHYYYYGMPPQTNYHPPEEELSRPKKSRRKKRPPTPSSSESESEEEYVEQPQYYQEPPSFKFNYA